MPRRNASKKTQLSGSAALIIVAVIGLVGTVISTVLAPILVKQVNEPPTPAPTVTPTNARRDWYAVFELRFPPGYWTEGIHNYTFDANCPFEINSTGADEPTYSFTVSGSAALQASTVYIRRRGLYLGEIETASLGDSLHPSQESAAVYTPYAFSAAEAQRLLDECLVQLRIDNGPFTPLAPIRIDQLSP